MIRKCIVLAVFAAVCGYVSTASVRDAFVKENVGIFNVIPSDARLDMLDYYDSGRVVSAKNAFGNGSELIEVIDNFISVKTTSVSSVEMYLSAQGKKDSVIIVNRTLLTPTPDGKIEFYNSAWQQLNTAKYFKTPTITDFIVIPDGVKKSKKEIAEDVDMTFISYTIDGKSGNLVAKQNLEKFLSKEDYAKIKPYLKDSINYEWTGKNFKELK